MAQNRFENSKAFYEEHKQELKDGFTVPLRQIAMALGGKVFELDDMIVTDPVRMVSTATPRINHCTVTTFG